jgi:hypothetical protein
MAAMATAEYYDHQSPPVIAVKDKEVVMDAVEDIAFGSVSQPSKNLSSPLTPLRLLA